MPSGDTLRQAARELAEERFIVGSLEDCYEEIQGLWRRLKITDLSLRVHLAGMPIEIARRSVELFSREVLPSLRKEK